MTIVAHQGLPAAQGKRHNASNLYEIKIAFGRALAGDVSDGEAEALRTGIYCLEHSAVFATGGDAVAAAEAGGADVEGTRSRADAGQGIAQRDARGCCRQAQREIARGAAHGELLSKPHLAGTVDVCLVSVDHCHRRVVAHHGVRHRGCRHSYAQRLSGGGGEVVVVRCGIGVTRHLPAAVARHIAPHVSALAEEEQPVALTEAAVTVGVVHLDGHRAQVVHGGLTIVEAQHLAAAAIEAYPRHLGTVEARHIVHRQAVDARALHRQAPPVATGQHRRRLSPGHRHADKQQCQYGRTLPHDIHKRHLYYYIV